MAKSSRVNGTSVSKTVEKLGSTSSIMEKYGLKSEEDAIAWAKDYVSALNDKQKAENETLTITFQPRRLELGENRKRHLGYLILQKVYYQLGMNLICDDIQKRRKLTYDLNNVMETLLYSMSISFFLNDDPVYYKFDEVNPEYVPEAVSILAEESNYIQSQLYKNSLNVIERDTALKCYTVLRQKDKSLIGLFMDEKGFPCPFDSAKSDIQYSKEIIVCSDGDLKNKNILDSPGKKHFVTTQPIQELQYEYSEWAIESSGWRRYIPISNNDTEKEIVYDINEIDKSDHAIFFKQTDFCNDGVKLYSTYLNKYQRYQRKLTKKPKYYWFYCVSSNLDSCDVLNVLNNKWEIEEAFGTLKILCNGTGIDFLMCYLTLFLYLFLVKYYMRDKYTATELLETIRGMEGLVSGDGLLPLFAYNLCCHELLMNTQIPLGTEYFTTQRLETILREVKVTPESVKELFD